MTRTQAAHPEDIELLGERRLEDDEGTATVVPSDELGRACSFLPSLGNKWAESGLKEHAPCSSARGRAARGSPMHVLEGDTRLAAWTTDQTRT